MVRIFLSLRFGEAMKEAEQLKQELERNGVSTFLCSVKPGGSIPVEIATNIRDAELVVILGTRTYGVNTGAGFSTFEELQYIKTKNKPFYLIKMCDCFEDALADFFLSNAIMYFKWMPGTKMPAALVSDIMAKLNDVSGGAASLAPAMATLAVQPPPPAENVYKGDVVMTVFDTNMYTFMRVLPGVTTIEGNVNIGVKDNKAVGSMIDEGQLAEMFSTVRKITGRLCIILCSHLTSLNGLRSLTTIGGFLQIGNCDGLTRVDGLRSLTTIGGMLNITFNKHLTSVEGLRNLKRIRRSNGNGEAILLGGNPNLARGLPFPALQCKNGTVSLKDNNAYVKLHHAALEKIPTC